MFFFQRIGWTNIRIGLEKGQAGFVLRGISTGISLKFLSKSGMITEKSTAALMGITINGEDIP